MSISIAGDIKNMQGNRDIIADVTVAESRVNLSQNGNDKTPARVLAMQNIGPNTLYFSRDGGTTWLSLASGAPWGWDRPMWTMLFKTLAGTARVQISVGY